MITEKELGRKYDSNTPHWRKDAVERYICEKHNQLTLFIRDHDLVVHANDETECN